MQLANSTTMAILCGITILIVLLQPVIFMIVAFKRGKELNMTDQEMKEAARSSAIFSIIPSLPIIVSYLLLVPSMGRYFPTTLYVSSTIRSIALRMFSYPVHLHR